jgi:hypothetical protein
MPTPNAYKVIQKQTLSSAAAGFTFTSIPSTYSHLALSVSFIPSGSSSYTSKAYFNNDGTAGNYNSQRLFEAGGTVTADRPTSNFLSGGWSLGGTSTAYDSQSSMFFYVFDYKRTNMFKHTIARVSDNDGGYHGAFAGLWKSTAAITRFDWESTTTQLPAGSVATLYGIL